MGSLQFTNQSLRNSPHQSPRNSPHTSPGHKNYERPMNPKGPDGQVLTYHACGAYRHLVSECPMSWENLKNVNVVQEEKVCLFTGYNRGDRDILGSESRNCAVLDSACTSTVCGRRWYDSYVGSMSEEDRNSVKPLPANKVFKFGGGEKLSSIMKVKLLCMMAGKEVMIETDVVESDIATRKAV